MISQIIAILISPILTRIYTPEDYGLLGIYAAFVAMTSTIASGKFDAALLLPKKDSNAVQLFRLCYRILLVFVLIILMLQLLFSQWFLELLNATSLSSYFFFTVISVFFLGGFFIHTNLLNRFKRYKGLATAKVSRTSGTSVGQLGFGFLGFGFTGLIFGRLVGEGLGFIVSRFFVERAPRYKAGKIETDIKPYKELINTYQDFPKITAFHAFTNSAASSLPAFILISFFSSTVVGWFNQCIKVTFLPITLISASTYQVFSQKVTELHNNNKCVRKITIETVQKLGLLGLLPFLFLLFFAPQAFAFVFSEEWRVAGEYARLLVPYLFMVFIVSPLAYLPILFGEQAKSFRIELVYLVLRTSSLLVGVYFNDPYLAIGLYGLAGFLTLSYVLTWYLKLSKRTK